MHACCLERAVYYVSAIIKQHSKTQADFDFDVIIEIVGEFNKTTARPLRFSSNDKNAKNVFHFNVSSFFDSLRHRKKSDKKTQTSFLQVYWRLCAQYKVNLHDQRL
jgi:hypothetical protein